MAYRTFLDNNGRYWQVWESHPHIFERRKSNRRQGTGAQDGGERRQSQDRRLGASARTEYVDSHLASGWLTFESLTEKRRLAPVPSHWDEMSQPELISLWERAQPVARIGDESSAA